MHEHRGVIFSRGGGRGSIMLIKFLKDLVVEISTEVEVVSYAPQSWVPKTSPVLTFPPTRTAAQMETCDLFTN